MSSPASTRPRLASVRSGIASIADQALASGASLGASLFVAARVPAEEHGRFALGWSLVALALAVHGAVVTEPALVHAQSTFAHRPLAHRRAVAHIHLVAAGGAAALLPVVGAASGSLSTIGAWLVVPATAFGLMTLTLVRRVAIGALRPDLALVASGVHTVGSLGALVAVASAGPLSASTALAVVGTSGVLASTALLHAVFEVGSNPWRSATRRAAALEEVIRLHLSHGRWALPAAAARWVPLGFPPVALPLVAGFEGVLGAGAHRVCLLLALPMMQAMSALGALAIPRYAAVPRAHRRVARHTVLATLAGAGHGAGVVLLGNPLLEVLGLSAMAAPDLFWTATIVMLQAPCALLTAALLADARSRAVFVATALAAASTCLVTLLVAPSHPLTGALLATNVGYGTTVAVEVALLMTPTRDVGAPDARCGKRDEG